jgi:diaminopimelate epimerase
MKFSKMSGAGNDFVVLDWTKTPGRPNPSKLAQTLCHRRLGVGADGLLILSKKSGKLRLSYFNSDGSAAFCGNGARCAAWWSYSKGLTKGRKNFTMSTAEGQVDATITGKESVSIAMPQPHDLRLGLKLKAEGQNLTVHAINTGVPHAVVEVTNLEDFPVVAVGRALRRHAAFAPAGANVNFIRTQGKGLEIRTYERGVEDETLACGTGATASALIAASLGYSRSPVQVKVQGGQLSVSFDKKGDAFSNVRLQGPAEIVFEGETHEA